VCFISAFITLNFATEPIGNNRCKQGLRLFLIYEQFLQSSVTAVCQLFGENRPPQFTPLLWWCTLGIRQRAPLCRGLGNNASMVKSMEVLVKNKEVRRERIYNEWEVCQGANPFAERLGVFIAPLVKGPYGNFTLEFTLMATRLFASSASRLRAQGSRQDLLCPTRPSPPRKSYFSD